MKKIIQILFLAILLTGCGSNTKEKETNTATDTLKTGFFNEITNIFDVAIKQDSDTYLFTDVQIIKVDRKENKLLAIIKNKEGKRSTVFFKFKKLPYTIPKFVDISTGSFVKESLPPILDGKKIFFNKCGND